MPGPRWLPPSRAAHRNSPGAARPPWPRRAPNACAAGASGLLRTLARLRLQILLLFIKKRKHLATLRYLQPTHSKYLQITVGSSRTLAILCSDAFSEDRDTAHTQFVKRRWRKFRDPCPTPCLKDGSRYSKPVPLFSLSKPLYESLSGWYLPRAVLEHSRHPMLPFEGFFAKHIRVPAKVGTCFAKRGGHKGHIMPKEVPRV